MRVGVPKESKSHEYRVGLTPSSVRELVLHGHEVMLESRAGHAIGLEDSLYRAAGARIVETPEEVFAAADLIVKVKEPQAAERSWLRGGQILFTYLHLAPDPDQTATLIARDCVAIAYETVTDGFGGLPLLTPMSEVAGRMAIQAGAHCLEMEQGGCGLLLGGVPGTPSARVVILGGGVVGSNAARVAMGFEAHVTVLDTSLRRLQALDSQFGPALNTIFSTVAAIEEHVVGADLVIGAVLIPGGAAPRLISEDMVRRMRRGSVFVDVSIDQGGCSETSRPTSHANPTYRVHDVVHYCVSNMPGAVARTSTFALNNATLPFVLALADKGYRRAMLEDRNLANGLNVHRGRIVNRAVAESLRVEAQPIAEALGE